MLTAIRVQAQTNLPAGVTPKNLQEGGSMPLPAGVTPDLTLDTNPALSFRPNPVGVGQTILVNMWLHPPVHVSRYLADYTVKITKPDGTTETIVMDSYRADTTAWFEYIVNQIGEWKLKFEFPGGYYPAGNYTVYAGSALYSATADTYTNFLQSCYYKPSSTAEQTLTVQQDFVYSWPPTPLPTDYWTRPASMENREWWPILGNYPGTGYVGGGTLWNEVYPDTNPYWNPSANFHPWIQAPNSAHIVWKRQSAIIGIIGGQAGQSGPISGAGPPIPSSPGLIYAGRCYQTVTKTTTQLVNGTYRQLPGSVAQCYDLRTGEIYYEIPTADGGVTPNIISYAPAYATISGKPAVPGGTAGAGWNAELLSISGGRLMKIDALTGAVNTNVSISPLTGSGGTYYMNNYVLYVQSLGGGKYSLLNWTTNTSTDNFTSRIISNTSYARSSLPSLIDYNTGIGATVSSVTSTATGTPSQTTIIGYSVKTGEQLWNITVDEVTYSTACCLADHGKVAILTQNGYYLAYDLNSGKLAWKSPVMDYPWSSAGFGAYAVQSAYGMIYREAYDGVYAFNWNDGKIAWKYKAPAIAYETPYIDENSEGVYSFDAGGIVADGKLFTYNTEHTPSLPLTRGWKLHAINATTGEGVWEITGMMSPGAVADGYLTAGDGYDGYLYVFGKGKSQTTVTAPDTAVPLGTALVVKGTVTDLSPAQPGTPCVSKDSMTTQMEYLHMQHPIDGILHNETVSGVSVTLTAVGSDGSYVDIGKTTTSGYYGTFGFAWTPDKEGTYEVIASFAGDDSYGSSAASTFVTVDPAPATITIPEQVTPPDYTMAIFGSAIAVIIAVAIVGVLLYRKK
jgi:PQQ-like domain